MKAALRAWCRRRRKALYAAHGEAPQALIRMFGASGLANPKVAAVYRAAGSEIDPRPLADWLMAQGVRIALPVVVQRDDPLLFREAVEGPFVADALGLSVPPPHAAVLRPGLVFVPLLAFDRTGARLGQGGGYYDRTLAALRAEGPPVRVIGLAYAGQELERVPTDAYDQRLDGVLSESAYLDFTGEP